MRPRTPLHSILWLVIVVLVAWFIISLAGHIVVGTGIGAVIVAVILAVLVLAVL